MAIGSRTTNIDVSVKVSGDKSAMAVAISVTTTAPTMFISAGTEHARRIRTQRITILPERIAAGLRATSLVNALVVAFAAIGGALTILQVSELRPTALDTRSKLPLLPTLLSATSVKQSRLTSPDLL